MSYQVLARKYRSQNFDQMIGQNHISQTIMNALKNNRLPHALLFTGIRGTGKTSSARILAKSIRCTIAQDFTPCGKCNSCIEITAGKAMDVIEIDGASNNGVDAMRDLRDNVMFSPSSGKYKIFIIDEVHMLSTSAFNALLKTLEEPPAHVIFIMATTEIQKIPQTILSRCQRFDFRRIPIKQLSDHLKYICDQEKIQIHEKALWMIARQGEGSARDSISLLDQVINFSSALNGELITDSIVSEILGLTDRSLVFESFTCLIERNDKILLSVLQKLATTSMNSTLFLEDILRLLRHSILLKSSESSQFPVQIDLPEDEINLLKDLIQNLNLPNLHMLFDMCLKSLTDVSRSQEPFLILEICLLRMAQAPQIKDLYQLMNSAEALPKSNSTELISPVISTKPIVKKVFSAPSLKISTNKLPSKETWYEFVQFLKKNEPILSAKIENLIFDQLSSENKIIKLEIPPVFGFLIDQITQLETKKKLQGFIDSFFGPDYTFEVLKAKTSNGESVLNLDQQKEVQAEKKLKDSWSQDSKIKAAQEIFNGTIKVINKENS